MTPMKNTIKYILIYCLLAFTASSYSKCLWRIESNFQLKDHNIVALKTNKDSSDLIITTTQGSGDNQTIRFLILSSEKKPLEYSYSYFARYIKNLTWIPNDNKQYHGRRVAYIKKNATLCVFDLDTGESFDKEIDYTFYDPSNPLPNDSCLINNLQVIISESKTYLTFSILHSIGIAEITDTGIEIRQIFSDEIGRKKGVEGIDSKTPYAPNNVISCMLTSTFKIGNYHPLILVRSGSEVEVNFYKSNLHSISTLKTENGHFSVSIPELVGDAPQKQTMDYLGITEPEPARIKQLALSRRHKESSIGDYSVLALRLADNTLALCNMIYPKSEITNSTEPLRLTPCGRPIRIREGAVSINDLSFSPNGDYLATARSDHTVSLFYVRDRDLTSCQPDPITLGLSDNQSIKEGHTAAVTAVAWLGDNRIASASYSGDIKVWRRFESEDEYATWLSTKDLSTLNID